MNYIPIGGWCGTKVALNPLLGQVTQWVTCPIKSELFPKK